MSSPLFRRKSATAALAETEGSGQGPSLRRTLGAMDLAMLGVGAIVGAGIFSSTGQMAAGSADNPGAGPALVLSYVITAVVCGFAALCYAEIAAMVPVAGSAYTYAYLALGELFAWIIGWDLIVEYAVGNIYVAQSWADYFRAFLRGTFGVDFPAWMATDLQTAAQTPAIAAAAPHLGDFVVAFNLPALLITAAVTAVLVLGIRESARANAVLVGFKVLLVLMFVGVGVFFIKPANYVPFAPNGFAGVWTGASLAFFSYIGFDAVSTAAEETRDPQRNLPRGIIGSLIVCTVLYVATAGVMTGMVPAAELGTGDPLVVALQPGRAEQPGHVHGVRGRGGGDGGAAGVPAGAGAHLHGHVARRAAAAGVRAGAPALPHPRGQHAGHGRLRRTRPHIHHAGAGARAVQHRHAVRVRDRVGWV